ncbi:MAG: TGS domain-containing protein [Candidatus Aenigmarchaeota archaeon]|nr:TGS domain-containing protein [Candidatus Aenigmarchaeota archaeon]
MPVNAGYEYFAAQKKYEAAKTTEEKIIALEEMIQKLPKHKGAENVLAQLKAKLSKLKSQKMAAKKRSGGRVTTVPKTGAGQVCIVGFANSGKSELLKTLTGVGEPSTTPYSTKTPRVGMMLYEDVQIQVVEIPSSMSPEFLSIAHNAELVIFLYDAAKTEDVERLTKVAESENLGNILWAANVISEKKAVGFAINAASGDNVDELKRMIWHRLGLVRVYTKIVGKKAESKPMTLPKRSTVRDVAMDVHKDFLKNFKFARVWGSAKFPGAQVGLGHVVKDKDIIEIHAG